MAEHFVKQGLKAPGTASFGGIADYQDPEKCVTLTGPGAFVVTGWVDAENSFGAKLRNRFVCKLHRNEPPGPPPDYDHTWTCDDLQMTAW